MNTKIILIAFILTFSCKSHNVKNKNLEDCLILNTVLKNKEITSISSSAILNNNPLEFFGMYNYWKESEFKIKHSGISFTGNIEWIFTKEEIKYMKEKYLNWNLNSWNNLCYKFDKITILNKEGTVITYPFYNENYTKAMTTISIRGQSTKIILLKKTNDYWENVGELEYNISH